MAPIAMRHCLALICSDTQVCSQPACITCSMLTATRHLDKFVLVQRCEYALRQVGAKSFFTLMKNQEAVLLFPGGVREVWASSYNLHRHAVCIARCLAYITNDRSAFRARCATGVQGKETGISAVLARNSGVCADGGEVRSHNRALCSGMDALHSLQRIPATAAADAGRGETRSCFIIMEIFAHLDLLERSHAVILGGL